MTAIQLALFGKPRRVNLGRVSKAFRKQTTKNKQQTKNKP